MRRFLRAFGAFWYDFLIGDDWKIAAAVAVVLVLAAGAVGAGAAGWPLFPVIIGIVVIAAFVLVFWLDVRAELRADREHRRGQRNSA